MRQQLPWRLYPVCGGLAAARRSSRGSSSTSLSHSCIQVGEKIYCKRERIPYTTKELHFRRPRILEHVLGRMNARLQVDDLQRAAHRRAATISTARQREHLPSSHQKIQEQSHLYRFSCSDSCTKSSRRRSNSVTRLLSQRAARFSISPPTPPVMLPFFAMTEPSSDTHFTATSLSNRSVLASSSVSHITVEPSTCCTALAIEGSKRTQSRAKR